MTKFLQEYENNLTNEKLFQGQGDLIFEQNQKEGLNTELKDFTDDHMGQHFILSKSHS